MPHQSPLILVKKPDGTFVRVPLSDIGKTTAAAAPATPAPAAAITTEQPAEVKTEMKPATTPAHHTLHHHTAASTKSAANAPTNTAAVTTEPAPKTVHTAAPTHHAHTTSDADTSKQHFPKSHRRKIHIPELDEAPVVLKRPEPKKPGHKFAHEDVISLLEEQAPTIDTMLTTTSSNRDSQVDEVLRTLPFKVPAEQQNRLRTIIQLYLKDVRGADETREVLTRPVDQGGIGLTKNQAQAVLGNAEETNNRLVGMEQSVTPVKSPAVPRTPPPAPATTMPLPKPVAAKPVPSAPAQPAREPVQRVTHVTDMAAPPERFTLEQKPLAKPVMHDVIVKPTTMGPVDEIRYLTTQDFRRLANAPEEAAEKVRLKFMHLKEESILLFLDALTAWRQSPLYTEYVSAVGRSLTSHQKLPAMPQDKALVQWPEIKALLAMEKQLAL